MTGEDGTYAFSRRAPGRYTSSRDWDRVPDVTRAIEIKAGESATVDFQLVFTPIRDQVTVTATGGSEELASNSFQAPSAPST